MDKQIVEQIKKLIAETRSDETMKDLHKTSYVRGYQAAISDIDRIITFAESLAAIATTAKEKARPV